MRKALIVAAVIIGIIALRVAYVSYKGSVNWYCRNSHAEVLINGHRVPAYVDESRSRLFLTRRDTARPHAYLLIPDLHSIRDCGDWYPYSWFVIAVAHLNPCTGSDLVGEDFDERYYAPEAPDGRLRTVGTTLEFDTRDGKRITVSGLPGRAVRY
jgi:hypothetical protein